MAYKIVATVDKKFIIGLSVYDWFYCHGRCLDQTYATKAEALAAANDAYKGPDVDGVEVIWGVDEVDA